MKRSPNLIELKIASRFEMKKSQEKKSGKVIINIIITHAD
jgi:hypothetical protein